MTALAALAIAAAGATLEDMSRPSRPARYADIEALPDNVVGEILEGVLYTHPRPAAPHALASSAIGEELGPPFKRGRGGPGGWVILDEPELHLVEDVIVPDLAGWRRERMPEVPTVAAFTLAPDWACEVLSPATEMVDRARKLPIYARRRVAHVWLVNPIAQTLEILRLDGDTYRLAAIHAADASVRAEPFDAIALDLAVFWAR
jgi:Uma2 family endonuclease